MNEFLKALCILWSGVLERSYGVEYWSVVVSSFGVIWNMVLEVVWHMVWEVRWLFGILLCGFRLVLIVSMDSLCCPLLKAWLVQKEISLSPNIPDTLIILRKWVVILDCPGNLGSYEIRASDQFSKGCELEQQCCLPVCPSVCPSIGLSASWPTSLSHTYIALALKMTILYTLCVDQAFCESLYLYMKNVLSYHKCLIMSISSLFHG